MATKAQHTLTLIVHRLPHDRPDWFEEFWGSIPLELRPCVALHEGIEGDTNRARAAAMQQVRTPYLAFADPDDRLVARGAMTAVEEAERGRGHGLIGTLERRIDADGRVTAHARRIKLRSYRDIVRTEAPKTLHHLSLMRTDLFGPWFYKEAGKSRFGIEIMAKVYMMMRGNARVLPVCGYEWRVHGSGAHQRYPTGRRPSVRRFAAAARKHVRGL